MTIAAILMLSFTFCFASDPQSDLNLAISKKITYPSFAVAQRIEGAVFVEFTVSEEGKIQVKNCNSLEGELQSYVYQTLDGSTVSPSKELNGKTFLMKFDFILE